MFEETTNTKDEKQMDILKRYWSENCNEVCTYYLTSLMFGRAKAEDLMFMSLQDDGPNINKAMWHLLNEELKKSKKMRLLPLLVCTIHTIHNGFHKGVDVYGQVCKQVAFDLHAWFKQAPCKQEDFRLLSDETK